MKASLNLFDLVFQLAIDNLARPMQWMQAGLNDLTSETNTKTTATERAESRETPISPQEQALWRGIADRRVAGPFHAPGSIYR